MGATTSVCGIFRLDDGGGGNKAAHMNIVGRRTAMGERISVIVDIGLDFRSQLSFDSPCAVGAEAEF